MTTLMTRVMNDIAHENISPNKRVYTLHMYIFLMNTHTIDPLSLLFFLNIPSANTISSSRSVTENSTLESRTIHTYLAHAFYYHVHARFDSIITTYTHDSIISTIISRTSSPCTHTIQFYHHHHLHRTHEIVGTA